LKIKNKISLPETKKSTREVRRNVRTGKNIKLFTLQHFSSNLPCFLAARLPVDAAASSLVLLQAH